MHENTSNEYDLETFTSWYDNKETYLSSNRLFITPIDDRTSCSSLWDYMGKTGMAWLKKK